MTTPPPAGPPADASSSPRPASPPRAGTWSGLVALDIDGTVRDADGVLPSVVEASARLREAGILVLVATGRPMDSALATALEVSNDPGFGVCSNGSVTIRLDPSLPSRLEVERMITFDPSFALDVLLADRPDAYCAIEVEGTELLLNRRFPAGWMPEDFAVKPLEELRSRPATRVVVYDTNASGPDFVDVAREHGLRGVTYAMGTTGWIDVTPPGISKGTALAELAERLRIPRERTMAIGDGANDIDMLEWAGIGVAMGNALNIVKERADRVTGALHEDGAATAMLSLLE